MGSSLFCEPQDSVLNPVLFPACAFSGVHPWFMIGIRDKTFVVEQKVARLFSEFSEQETSSFLAAFASLVSPVFIGVHQCASVVVILLF